MKEITGNLDHRILLNYRIDPDVVRRLLPPPFSPKIVNGFAIGGICQVTLSKMRPKGFPPFGFGTSHNAAHRIAVLSPEGEGVFVPRRDTSSWINAISSGRVFPGVFKKADFKLQIEDDRYRVDVQNDREKSIVTIDATISDQFPSHSIFENLRDISKFFQGGNIGWSKNTNGNSFDAIELRTAGWGMQPMAVQNEHSAYFTHEKTFPKGSVEFDSAMIMQNLKHSWIAKSALN